ncbi:L-rhamnose/proton symporter RhaT [Oceanidesulfovibrio marinus]|uniref:Rhamnose/proton symporter RhaT n=1 Tax=Oceanidesulfovibrio marinus TaxID=370038 RepID=A0A6P1ZLA2_9BACT|nr:L-rhamnose/proton symporter RhaT [Oceanidesulfovibrio marinus]QJT07570.1 rhamnose/proton symporter RhaT [Oceanidesulfovibrio marinus]TVM34516.1 rhamnose/proton symporter RhaT [Oceanidesulfovibrio marinus]
MISGFFVLLVASGFQGSFGLGMKNYRPFSWEAFWVVFSVIGILCFPILWTSLEVPHFATYIWATPSSVLWVAAACGFLWGVSAIWYGKSIDYIGLSLTVGINTGVGCSLGALIPLFILNDLPSTNSMVILLLGMAVMLVGVGVITKAGLLKDKQGKTDASVTLNEKFMVGLLFALISGFGTAAINVGYSYAHTASDLAVAAGVNPVSASLIAYVIVFASGGFLANVIYALYILFKNKSYDDFTKKGAGFAYFKAILTGALWFAALGLYGKSAALLGDLGTVIGWIVFLSLALVISNFWGIKTGEWKGFKKPLRVMNIGNAILLISVIIVGYANSLA